MVKATLPVSLQRGERRLSESNRELREPRCIGRRRRHGVTSMAAPQEAYEIVVVRALIRKRNVLHCYFSLCNKRG